MASKGQEQLEAIIQSLLPRETLVHEFHVGNRLRLDLFYPKHMLAFEYHGRQHFEYVEHFHGDVYGFQESIQRDRAKEKACKERGIVLLVFAYDDIIDEESVFKRMQDAITTSEALKPVVPEKSEYHKNQLAKAREARKANYQRMKELKKRNDGR